MEFINSLLLNEKAMFRLKKSTSTVNTTLKPMQKIGPSIDHSTERLISDFLYLKVLGITYYSGLRHFVIVKRASTLLKVTI